MKRILAAVLASASCLSIVPSASAQDDIFDKQARGVQVEKFHSMNSPGLKNRGTDAAFDSDLGADSASDPNKHCAQPAGGGPPGYCNSEALPQAKRGSKERALVLNGPMRSHAEAVGSVVYTNQKSTYLGSPNMIYNVTVAYLDHGVFAAGATTYSEGTGAVGLRNESQALLLQQASLNPEIRDVAVSSYINCLKSLGGGTVASNTCLEDSPIVEGAGFQASGNTATKWLEKHPEHAASGGTPDTLMLTDLLIEPSIRAGQPQADADAFKASFKRIFGDMKIFSPTSAYGAPKVFQVQAESPELLPSAHDALIHDFVWKKLHELMRGYCEYTQTHLDVTPSSHKPFDYSVGFFGGGFPFGIPIPYFVPIKTSFWGNRNGTLAVAYGSAYGPDDNTFIDLTTTDFEFTPELGDSLFSLFMKTQDVKASSERQGKLNCDMLKSEDGDDSNYQKLAAEPEKYAMEWRGFFDRAVNIIARGKRYEIYNAGRAWVDQQTAAGEDSDTRDKAYSLIRTVMTNDPARLEENLELQAVKFKQELAKRRQSEVGVLGHSLAKGISERGAANLSGGAGES